MERWKSAILFATVFKALITPVVIMFMAAQAWCEDVPARHEANAYLLKFPYPYRAALTVASDTHRTPVETFEAVHLLINTQTRIRRDSETWRQLFSDPEIYKRETWREGISGFGLPIADSMYLYGEGIGVFAGFDQKTGEPVSHAYKGRDFRDIVDDWLRRGWVDTLHTPGPYIRREGTAAGLKWLQDRPHGHLKVWSNHNITGTPTCVGPDQPAFPLVIKNIIKCGTTALSWVGMESLARKIAHNPYPYPFPIGQKKILWLLAFLLVSGFAGLLLCLILKRFRRRFFLLIASLLFASVLVILHLTPLHYAQGDNPDSQYYHSDLLRQFGFQYYWLISPLPDYKTHVPDTLLLPERSYGGRPSCLRIVRLDDGFRCIAFGRCYKGKAGMRSLELLTDQELEKLCNLGGTSIIYTHWTERPRQVFTAQALEGLTRLRRFYEAGHIWVAPTSEILHFTFIRAYLEFAVTFDNGRRIIEIVTVNNPAGKAFIPTLEDLRGISFECPASEPIDIRLGGTLLDKGILDTSTHGDRTIISFPLRHL